MHRPALLAALLSIAGAAHAQSDAAPVPVLKAVEVARFKAPEATQGVAADARYVYAVANSRIAKYDKASGKKVAEWVGERARFPHINSCEAIGKELVCANSNYPQVPQRSSVEFFDPATMTHLRTVSLGQQIGSLTWVDRKDGAWWAGFANYDRNGAEPGRDHRYSAVVKFDDQWRRMESWAFPASVLDRFEPTSTSGGGWGADGLLYVTGHDRPEVYVLRLPKGGSALDHLATIDVQVEGQAIAFDKSQPGVLFGISRPGREVVAMRLPVVGTK